MACTFIGLIWISSQARYGYPRRLDMEVLAGSIWISSQARYGYPRRLGYRVLQARQSQLTGVRLVQPSRMSMLLNLMQAQLVSIICCLHTSMNTLMEVIITLLKQAGHCKNKNLTMKQQTQHTVKTRVQLAHCMSTLKMTMVC